MGLLDKLKSVTDVITGGAAKIHVTIKDFCIGETFTVNITVTTSSNPVKFDQGYLQVRGMEEVKVIETRTMEDEYGNYYEEEYETTEYNETFCMDDAFSEGKTLDADSTFKYSIDVLIPEGSRECHHGPGYKHYYKFLAGLDTFGNDPDSGWVYKR